MGKTAEAEASGSKTAGGKGKQRATSGQRTRSRGAADTSDTSRAMRALIPVLVEAHADHELRTLVQVMASMDARIAALRQANKDAENMRAAATRSLAALVLRRELEEAEWAEAAEAGEAGEGNEDGGAEGSEYEAR